MSDPRVETVARILVDYSVDTQPGQFVVIQGTPQGAPLILAIYQRILEEAASFERIDVPIWGNFVPSGEGR